MAATGAVPNAAVEMAREPRWLRRVISMAVASKAGKMEAAIGFEPMHRGFADLSLTTWVRRLEQGLRTEQGITALPAQAINNTAE